MKVIVRGKNVHISKNLQEKVEKKLAKLDKYFSGDGNTEARVLVRNYPYGQKIEVTIPADRYLLRAEEMNEDLLAALDLVVDKLEGQIRKNKTRLSKRNKSEGLAFNIAALEDIDDTDEDEDEVVKTKVINPTPMDLEEAILQMEMLGHNFYIYRDTESNRVAVVYRRDHGGYGLLETE